MLPVLSLLALTSIVSAAPLISRANVLLDTTGAHATVYYDLTDSLCGNDDPFPTNWAVKSGINGGIPKCEQWAHANAKSLAGLGTNRIVAIDASLLAANPDEWCGKEVAIFDSDGKQIQFSEGPLFVWDGCAACSTQPIVDISAKALVELKGGTCGGNNPGGLSFQVLNNNIWDPILQDGTGGGPAGAPGSSVSSATTATPTGQAKVGTTVSRTRTSVVVVDPTPSVDIIGGINKGVAMPPPMGTSSGASSKATASSPPTSSSGCTYGAWQCDGLSIDVCNYVTTTSLDWVTVANCPSKCAITSTGSVDCE